jgi:hypothetical protein
MATVVNSSFQSMLNEYLPNRMIMEELVKRDWFLSNLEIDNGWQGSKIIVPFKGAGASTVEFGQLADVSDISQSIYVRGSIDSYVEAWASLVFNHRDLLDAEGKIPEATFLKILPGEVDSMVDYFKQVVSTSLGAGSHFAQLVTDGQVGGTFEVDHIDRFQIGQKLVLDDANSAPLTVYVIAINVNAATTGTGTVTVSATRGGLAADVSAYTVAQAAKCYHPGALAGSFTSIREVLLSAANGGSSTVHGVSKLLYPILQATNIDGSGVSSSNILDKLFDGYTEVRRKAKGNANTVLMSFKHLGSIMKLVETQKGPFSVTKQPSASLYGWTELQITSVKGVLTIVGIAEMDDDVIMYLDLKSMVFRTRGGFRKRKSPEGKEYFEVRGTDGFKYVVDMCLFGQLEVNAPGHNAIMHSIDYDYVYPA